jgi:hypothetical protein
MSLDCRIMIIGNGNKIQPDPLNNQLFTNYRKKEIINGKIYCSFSYFTSNGERCNKKGEKDDKIGKYIRCMEYDGIRTCNFERKHRNKKLFHECINPEEVERQKILQEFSTSSKKIVNESDMDNKEKAYHKFLCLISECKISISSSISSSLWDFLHFCMSSYKNNLTYENPKDFLDIPNKRKVSDDIIKEGKNILNDKLTLFSGHYGSVLTDGFCKRRRKIKAFIVSFPQFDGKHEVVELASINNTQEMFSMVGAKVIDYLESRNINVCTVNCDGYGLYILFYYVYKILVSQCNAFLLSKPQNFESYLRIPQKIKTFHTRCSNHLINLAINNFLKENSWIEEFEKIILYQIIDINNNENFKKSMGGRGPSEYKTRWYWRCDVIDYIRNKYQAYTKIYDVNAIEYNQLCYFGLLFEGTLALHRMCEKSTASLPIIFSFFLQYFEYVDKILSFSLYYVFNKII